MKNKNLQVFHHNIIETKCFEQIAPFLENQPVHLSNLFWHKVSYESEWNHFATKSEVKLQGEDFLFHSEKSDMKYLQF